MNQQPLVLAEVLPPNGLIYAERAEFSEVLCQPKLMPLKSITLQKLQQMEEDASKLTSKTALQ